MDQQQILQIVVFADKLLNDFLILFALEQNLVVIVNYNLLKLFNLAEKCAVVGLEHRILLRQLLILYLQSLNIADSNVQKVQVTMKPCLGLLHALDDFLENPVFLADKFNLSFVLRLQVTN